jgi:hypothetical protein
LTFSSLLMISVASLITLGKYFPSFVIIFASSDRIVSRLLAKLLWTSTTYVDAARECWHQCMSLICRFCRIWIFSIAWHDNNVCCVTLKQIWPEFLSKPSNPMECSLRVSSASSTHFFIFMSRVPNAHCVMQVCHNQMGVYYFYFIIRVPSCFKFI